VRGLIEHVGYRAVRLSQLETLNHLYHTLCRNRPGALAHAPAAQAPQGTSAIVPRWRSLLLFTCGIRPAPAEYRTRFRGYEPASRATLFGRAACMQMWAGLRLRHAHRFLALGTLDRQHEADARRV
jgi:hypothetical protein